MKSRPKGIAINKEIDEFMSIRIVTVEIRS